MLIKAKDVIDLKIITLDEGKEIDKVQDVLYDPKTNTVKALLVDEGGWFSDAKVLLMSDIYSIGKDAVIIENENKTKHAGDVGGRIANIARDEKELTRSRIMTEQGEELGRVNDLYFDSETGNVEEFEVSQGALKDIGSGTKRVKISDVVTIGEDMTVVRAYTVHKFEQQAKQGGVQGAFRKGADTVKQKTSEYASKAQKKAGQLSEEARTKTEDIQNHPRTRRTTSTLHEIVRDFNRQTNEWLGQTQHKMDEMRSDPGNKQKVRGLQTEAERVLSELLTGLRQLDREVQQRIDEFRSDPNTQRALKDAKENARKVQDRAEEMSSEAQKKLGDEVRMAGKAATGKSLQTQKTDFTEEHIKETTERRYQAAGSAGGRSQAKPKTKKTLVKKKTTKTSKGR